MAFASEFVNDIETISKTLLQLSTSNDGVAEAELKVRALEAINNVQTKYKEFLKYARIVIDNLSAFPSFVDNGAIDKAFDGVKILEDIEGKSAMVLDMVSF